MQHQADSLAELFAAQGIVIDPHGTALPTPGIHDQEALEDSIRRYGPTFEDQARALGLAADAAAMQAVRSLDQARGLLREHTSLAEYSRGQFFGLAGALNAVYSGYTSAVSTHEAVTDALTKKEKALSSLYKNAARKTSKTRIAKAWAAYDRALKSTAVEREALRKAAEKGAKAAKNFKFSSELSTTFGQIAKESAPAGLSRLGQAPVLRRLPVIGTLLTGIQIQQDIADGNSPTKAVTANITSLAAGTLIGEGAVVLAAGIGITVGAPVLASLAIGTAAAVGVGYAVNAFFETEVGHDISQTVDHAVGDAAHAVGDAVSGTWRKLFG